MNNGRFKGASALLRPHLPTETDEWNEEGWVQQEERMLAHMEKEYVETLRKRHPGQGPEAGLRRQYDAAEITEAEYLAKRSELRREERGWA